MKLWSLQPRLLAQLGQDLGWLHGVAPLIVAARVILGRQPARCPVPRVEPVLQVQLRLPDQVVTAEQVPVVDLHRQDRVLGERGFHFKTPVTQ